MNEKSEKISKKNEALKKPDSSEFDEQENFQKDPSSYNGASRQNYSWTQSIKDIDVRVKVKCF